MFAVGKKYHCDSENGSFSFTVKKINEDNIKIAYGNKTCLVEEEEIKDAKPEEEVEEDTTTSASVSQGVKIQYIGNGPVKPMIKAKRKALNETRDGYIDLLIISEEVEVQYNAFKRLATLVEGEEIVSQCRATNADWTYNAEGIYEYLEELHNENN